MEILKTTFIAILLGVLNFAIREHIEEWLGKKMDLLMWALFTFVVLSAEIKFLTEIGVLK